MTDKSEAEFIAAANRLRDALDDAAMGYPAAEAVYALGLLIADAVRQSETNDPEDVFRLLREVVAIELMGAGQER